MGLSLDKSNCMYYNYMYIIHILYIHVHVLYIDRSQYNNNIQFMVSQDKSNRMYNTIDRFQCNNNYYTMTKYTIHSVSTIQ